MKTIRNQIARHLEGGDAFMPIEKVIEKIDFDTINTRPFDLPYSFYEVFFHIVFAQKDIVKFTCSDDYTKPKWPDYYWSKDKICRSRDDWDNLKAEYFSDRARLKQFLLDETNPLDQAVKNGKDDQTLIRELLLVIEHSAYHTGQLVVILRLLNLH